MKKYLKKALKIQELFFQKVVNIDYRKMGLLSRA